MILTSKPIPAAELERITTERLDVWGKRMLEYSSTPLLAVGIGHNECLGQVSVHITEDLPIADVRAAIIYLYDEIVNKRREP